MISNYQYDIGRDGLQPQRKVLVPKKQSLNEIH